MGPFEAVKTVFSKYATFSGRASRSEFWWWKAFLLFGPVLAAVILWQVHWLLALLAPLIFIIPNLAVGVRRFHDVGKSGAMFLVLTLLSFLFIPALYMFYLQISDSQPGENQYGPNPKDEVKGARGKGQEARSKEQEPRSKVQSATSGSRSHTHGARPSEQRHESYEYAKVKQGGSAHASAAADGDETVFKGSSSAATTMRLVYGGQSIPLFVGRNVVGRKADSSPASAQIPANDLYMSRQHCVIDVKMERDGTLSASLSNYKNKNRTAVQGRLLTGTNSVELADGNQITLGHTNVIFKL
ncbi:MAG: DUF805 domain-containing protein [Prevotella sp.]|nr:DUF805 domain-containing protein [Prevotella sp.]